MKSFTLGEIILALVESFERMADPMVAAENEATDLPKRTQNRLEVIELTTRKFDVFGPISSDVESYPLGGWPVRLFWRFLPFDADSAHHCQLLQSL